MSSHRGRYTLLRSTLTSEGMKNRAIIIWMVCVVCVIMLFATPLSLLFYNVAAESGLNFGRCNLQADSEPTQWVHIAKFEPFFSRNRSTFISKTIRVVRAMKSIRIVEKAQTCTRCCPVVHLHATIPTTTKYPLVCFVCFVCVCVCFVCVCFVCVLCVCVCFVCVCVCVCVPSSSLYFCQTPLIDRWLGLMALGRLKSIDTSGVTSFNAREEVLFLIFVYLGLFKFMSLRALCGCVI